VNFCFTNVLSLRPISAGSDTFRKDRT